MELIQSVSFQLNLLSLFIEFLIKHISRFLIDLLFYTCFLNFESRMLSKFLPAKRSESHPTADHQLTLEKWTKMVEITAGHLLREG